MTGTPVLVVAALVVAALVLSGCGGAASPDSQASVTKQDNRTPHSGMAATASASVSRVKLHLYEGSRTVESARAMVRGTVTRGARVRVNGRPAHVRATKWRRAVHLHLGRNRVRVTATLAGTHRVRRTITIVRKRSAAEIERRRLVREAAEERKAAEEAKARAAEEERETEEATSPSTPAGAPSGEECTNGTYVNSAGNVVCRPEEAPSPPAGATAECEDGTYSFSESRSGTCSHHGGVKRWL